ncbi:MAG: YdeI/OmpD-associated family protein, partial [Pseudomonadota bacterium]|nr:YdeI/OmpD-associated family protein [Pseudomonadota bacterium]
ESIADLPDAATLNTLIRKAMALTDAGTKAVRSKKAREAIAVPDDLRTVLVGSPQAQAHFDAFSPSAQRDYAEWVVTAKQAATREKRIAQAVEWIAEGKKRNWKYEKC